MKQYFTQLLAYDHATNLKMLQAIQYAGAPDNAVKLMAHTLGAQKVWLGRCKQDPNAPGGAIWPEDWALDLLFNINDENHAAWVEFVQQQEDFEQTIRYQNSKGDAFADKLSDVLAHLINHGTHHRAQIGQQLKLGGANQLPATDYIFYVRGQQK